MLLFCYGSLEFAEVMRAVTGGVYEGEPATLEDFARYRVRDADYPGVVPEPGRRTEGTLFRGLDERALAALDRFEGALYERRMLDVRRRSGERVAAQVYVVSETQRDALTDEPWDAVGFARDHLPAFVRRLGAPNGT